MLQHALRAVQDAGEWSAALRELTHTPEPGTRSPTIPLHHQWEYLPALTLMEAGNPPDSTPCCERHCREVQQGPPWRLQGSPHRPSGELKTFLPAVADFLVLSKIRKMLGFSHCQKHFSGAAPISAETLEFFLGLNITLYEAYGMSETSGPHVMSGPHNHRFQCCGKAVPGCQMKLENKDLDGNGEICFWGRTVFMGYLNMEDKTRDVFDKDGWLHSGDIGKIDSEGFLQVTGRIKELIITAGGENIPPILIEDAVKRHLPIVSNAVLIGDRRKFLSMLLTLKSTVDQDTLEPSDRLTSEAIQFCQQVGSKATTVSEIVAQNDRAVYTAIQEGIDKVNNEAVSNAQRVQKWTILSKDFSIAGGEMGPTMKIKRHAILDKYNKDVEAFYSPEH
ncbi:unnamed protein product [Ranitomeya imitator]|uniref:long-chain-fatty-acid--CoA ligase n=1 Tax=Ranitomeya imitator TaxID=111125 RepID=A0ABN9LRS9_9NEOB|nr:unnamed protein product [Ranitomeya imitator]